MFFRDWRAWFDRAELRAPSALWPTRPGRARRARGVGAIAQRWRRITQTGSTIRIRDVYTPTLFVDIAASDNAAPCQGDSRGPEPRDGRGSPLPARDRVARMTFLVAFARPDFALLASDTRTTMRSAPDAPALDHDDAGAKIFPWETGWLASGPSIAWRKAVLAGEDRAETLARLAPEQAQMVRERQLTMTIGVDAAGCFRHVLTWEGVERFPGPQHIAAALCPTGSDPATLQRLLNSYQAEITRAPLPLVLEATARLYAIVYAHCGPDGTVSPLLTVGLVHPSGRRALLGPQPHDAIFVEVAHA